jgi:hypothetical protein
MDIINSPIAFLIPIAVMVIGSIYITKRDKKLLYEGTGMHTRQILMD